MSKKALKVAGVLLGTSLMSATASFASDARCGAGKCGGNMDEKPVEKKVGNGNCGAQKAEKKVEEKIGNAGCGAKKADTKAANAKCGGNK
ncbi:MAG: hypothetical protein ACNI3C_03635 [Candidatus Marinarcus sp.]|uniref:hypothetical protein n=1 Tax=Candidatus Marinarcus sp. TaxID=3100987 RepID=UPI003AFF98B4